MLFLWMKKIVNCFLKQNLNATLNTRFVVETAILISQSQNTISSNNNALLLTKLTFFIYFRFPSRANLHWNEATKTRQPTVLRLRMEIKRVNRVHHQ